MIKDILQHEGPINGIFMVRQQIKATSNSGAPYLSLTLQDASGSVEARMWSIGDSDIEISAPGALIRIEGMMANFKGHPQLKILTMDGVNPGDVDISKYIPTAPVAIEKLKAHLKDLIDSIHDEKLRTLTGTLIRKHYQAYTSYPAAVSVHHAYFGGLMYHSLSICDMAVVMQKHYTELSHDYLVAGALLHDIGKVKELSCATAASYTQEGNLLGHINLGAMMVYEEGIREGMDSERLDVLTHIILAHHGEPEFGSPKTPATREAYVIRMLDDLDAKLELLKAPYDATREGDFTQKVVWFDNKLFFKPHSLD